MYYNCNALCYITILYKRLVKTVLLLLLINILIKMYCKYIYMTFSAFITSLNIYSLLKLFETLNAVFLFIYIYIKMNWIGIGYLSITKIYYISTLKC